MPRSVADTAYDLALRAIEQQERRLHELRSRSGTLVAAASLAASVLGAQAARSGQLETLAGVAIVAYLCCVLAALYLLLPHRLVLEFRGSVLADLATEAGAEADEATRVAAQWIEGFHEHNRGVLRRLSAWYSAALIAVGAEVVLWTVSLTDRVL